MSRISAKDKENLTAEVRNRGGQCAIALLRRDGWNRFTMENLAAEMGVAKGTIYNYFEDKADVVSFIIQCRSRLMAEEIGRMSAREPDTCELLRQVVRKYLRGSAEFRFLHTAVFEVVHKNSVSEGESLRRLKELLTPLKELFAAIEGVFRRGMDEGVFRRSDVSRATSVFHAMLSGVGMCGAFDSRLDADDPAACDAVAEAILKGFVKEEK
ncbi:MAG: TetR/AcrR family transcriptional regulator [Pyramidobacter sp.]